MIAFDNSAQKKATGDTSWLHTTAGTERYILVGIVTDRTVTGVTYNSVALTQLGTVSGAGAACYLYGLVNPTSGANSVAVTFSAGASERVMWSISLTGVSQAVPIGTVATHTVGSSQSTTNITVLYNNSWTVEAEGTAAASGAFTQNSSQNEREELQGTTSYSIAGATKAQTAGATSLMFTSTINTTQYDVVAEVIASDAINTSNNLMYY